MRKFWVLFLWVALFVVLTKPQIASAQVGQNVVLSCLDATVVDPMSQTINGRYRNHLVSLTNKEKGVFSPNQPIYVVRSLARTFCLPGANDPDCTRDEQERFTTCNQEKIGSALCNQNCTMFAPNHVCSANNSGPGVTTCCMPLYTKQGPYFECSKDNADQLVCPSDIMASATQNNGIHVAENGHIETGFDSRFNIVSYAKSALLADANGDITIPMAESYTKAALDHSFYGMQIVSSDDMNENEAFKNSLKLAVFSEIENIEPSATNCTTVFWDPFGKVIDALKLEPITGVNVLLRNQTATGQVIDTTVAENPTFTNPVQTDLGGNFSFAVNPGTYFLVPSKTGFTFPIDSTVLDSARSKLAAFDPNQEYIKRDKLYNSSSEPIIESAGVAERRDIILMPSDTNYAGSAPKVLYAENLRDGTNQLIRGRSSHPKSLVKVYLNGTVIAQTQASFDGAFSLSIPQEVLGGANSNFQIVVEKTPIVTANNTSARFDLFSWLVSRVLAEEITTSRPYSLSLVPLRITGFVFDTSLKVKPNSVVQVSVPSMGGMTFAQARADKDGFVDLKSANLPPFDFVLTVRDPEDPSDSYQLTVSDFQKTNSVYLADTRGSLYSEEMPMEKPSATEIEKIKAETPNRVAMSSLTFNKQPTPSSSTNNTNNTTPATSSNTALVFVFLFFLFIIVVGAVLIIGKNKQNKGVYY